jgi:bifunctional non-homologous end joining protein LigD
MRLNRSQEFVIGGYALGGKMFDALVFGYYEGDRLVCVGRTRSGFTPALRAQLWRRFRGLEITECPFANLPEARSGRWGEGLTADKMKECRWLRPLLVAQVEFVEWTADGHRGMRVSLRCGKTGRRVMCNGRPEWQLSASAPRSS